MLKIAEAAAREAGSFLLHKLGQGKIEQQKSSRDDLLDVDTAAEDILLKRLRQETPTFGTLSEEAGLAGNQKQHWIIDPLDGSANFQHGSPAFAIAIALVIENTTCGALIYVPAANELFTAIRHQGAYLNGKRIGVSAIATLAEAMVHVGDLMKEGKPAITHTRTQHLAKLLMQARRVRMIGTAATDLAYLSCGRADVLVNAAKNPWDVEAGKLLLLEAGGTVTTQRGSDDEILAIYSNGRLHDAVERLLIPE